ncbi:MAG: C1 family peptidase, partial [Armatimonadota bacterium]
MGWATAYYYKSFQEGKERGWTFGSTSQRISPAFVYNLINGGQNVGTTFGAAFSILKRHGASSLAKMSYSSSNYTSWPSVSAWREGMNYRASSYALLYHASMGSASGYLDKLKSHLAAGDCCVIGIPVYSDFYCISSFPDGVYDGPLPGVSHVGDHALCMVGYDDNKGGGAFKVVNSWGTSWGQSGYGWLSYDFIGGYLMEAWTMIDRDGYQAQALAEVHISHPARNQLRVTLATTGYSDVVLNCQGGAVANIDAAFDITDKLSCLPPSSSYPWRVEVRDVRAGSVGQIAGFFIEHGASTWTSPDPPVPIPDGGTATASVTGDGGSSNSPPYVASVAISPDPAYTTSDLTAVPSGWSDPDGDAPGYHWRWDKMAAGTSSWQIIAGATTSSLAHTNFAKGDQVRVTCTPWDGTEEGSAVTDTITISNSAPTAATVNVTPDSPKTTDALSVSASGSTDPDGDAVSYRYRWYRDGALQSAYNDATSVP